MSVKSPVVVIIAESTLCSFGSHNMAFNVQEQNSYTSP